MGMVTIWSCDLNYLNKLMFPYPKDIPHEVVIEENKFKNIESERFGPRSVNDLDLWYS